jgi:hypothetical protein
MGFYILVGLVVVLLGWILARSPVMKAWLRGRGSDPSSSGIDRMNEAGRDATWRDDGTIR